MLRKLLPWNLGNINYRSLWTKLFCYLVTVPFLTTMREARSFINKNKYSFFLNRKRTIKCQQKNPATSVKQEYPTLYSNIPYGISLPCSVFNLTIYCWVSWQQAVQVEVESDWGELINVVAAWNVVQLPVRIMFVCLWPKCEMAGCWFQKCECTFLYLTRMNTFFVSYTFGEMLKFIG